MDGYVERIHQLIVWGRIADAEKLAREAVAEHPDDAAPHAMLARALVCQRRPEEAEAEARTAIGLDPHYSYGFLMLSYAHWQKNHCAAAWVAVEEAIRLESRNVWYLSARVKLLEAMGQRKEAAEAAEEVLSIDPRDVGALSLHARLVGDFRPLTAARELEQALEIDPQNAAAHLARGKLLLQYQRDEEALRHLLEARRIDPVRCNAESEILTAMRRLQEPFRTLGRGAPQWHRWPSELIWPLGILLALIYGMAYSAFPSNHDWASLAAGLIIFVANSVVFAPLALDFVAWAAAATERPQGPPSVWRQALSAATAIVAAAWVLSVAILSAMSPYALMCGVFFGIWSAIFLHYGKLFCLLLPPTAADRVILAMLGIPAGLIVVGLLFDLVSLRQYYGFGTCVAALLLLMSIKGCYFIRWRQARRRSRVSATN